MPETVDTLLGPTPAEQTIDDLLGPEPAPKVDDLLGPKIEPAGKPMPQTAVAAQAEDKQQGLISKAWGFLTRPLAKLDLSPSSIVESARQFTAASLGVDASAIAHKPTEASVKEAMARSPVAAASIGVVKGLENLDSFFTSPLGIATLGVGALPATAQRLVAAGFSAQMISQTPELARQLGTELGKPPEQRDYQKIGELVTSTVANTGFSVAGVLHAAKPSAGASPLEKAADATKPVAPVTAAALKEQAASEAQAPAPTQPKEIKREVPAEEKSATSEAVGKPTAPEKPQEVEKITAAEYRDEEGDFYTGANHPEILERLGIEGFDTPESRNTPQFGFFTSKGRHITREEAGPLATAAGQNLKQFEPGEPVHSNEVAAPSEPDKPISETDQPVQQAPAVVDQISKVSAMGPEEFFQFSKGGKTQESYQLGQSVETPEQLESLRQARDKANAEFAQLAAKAKTEEDLQDLAKIAVKGQYFSEAYGAATGSGSAGAYLRETQPGYTPRFPEKQAPTKSSGGLSDTKKPVSVGPGAASPGDVPAAGRQASAAGARVEQAPPASRPMGPVSSVSIALNKLSNQIRTGLKALAGESMPKTTAANRETGEAGVRYGASKIAAPYQARAFVARALQGTGVDPVKLGAALTEDNLRSVREALRGQASELLANGDEEGAARASDQADQVATMIGVRGSPFASEDDYFDYLGQPEVQRAIAQHIQLWQEVIDPQYRAAREIDPDVELPSRGQQTGARINLKAVFEDDNPANAVRGGVGAPSLTATFKRRTPFALRAKGTGETYDINYNSIIANTFERQLEIANKNKFDDSLVTSGDALIDSPGKQVRIKGERAVPFPLTRRVIVSGGKSFSQSRNIYVRESLSDEYRTVSNVDPRHKMPVVAKVMGLLNRSALAGLTDATVHFSNQMTALFNRPTSGKLFSDSLLAATGRADIPVTLTKFVIKAFRNNTEQLSNLAEIGALRPGTDQPGILHLTGRLLRRSDQVTRLVLDDTFKSLADEGIIENTETARREYVNQIGQYNRRLQGPMMRFFRETGLGPFATAGRAFNVLGVKMGTMSPGVKGVNAYAASMLRANTLSKWIGGTVLVGTLNYLLTKDKGGGMMGRPGTPIGDVDFGTNDASGKQESFPMFSVLGLGRGLRVMGIKGAVESKRLGLTNADAIESASRDIINSSVAPFAGPAVRAGFIGASGFPPAVEVGRASRVAAPGESQRLENLKEALIEANPIVQSYVKYTQGKPTHEVMAGQLPRFSLVPRKTPEMIEKYPKIVSLAQGAAFIDDTIFQARRLSKDERRAFLGKQFERLPPNQREHAWNEAKRRHVFK